MNYQLQETENDFESIDIRQYLALFWQWAWLIALVTVLAGLVAFLVSQRMTPVYSAATTLYINEAPSSKATDYNSIITSERISGTYSKMITTRPILEEVGKRTGVDVEYLEKRITVSPIRDTTLIQITVESNDPSLAAQIANELANVFSDRVILIQEERFSLSKESLQTQITAMEEQIDEATSASITEQDPGVRASLETKLTQYRAIYSNLILSYEQIRLSEAQTVSTVLAIDPATIPTKPISPQVLRNTALAAMVGLMLAVGVIFLIEALDDTLKTPEDVKKALGLPVLGIITKHDAEEGKPITNTTPRSPVSEAFRSLRTNIQYTAVDRPIETILITSSDPKEGKTTIVTNLGVVFAQMGKKVTLIDADLRKPTLHRKIGLQNRTGLTSLFVRSMETLELITQKSAMPNLNVITSGELPPNPSELLGSKKMQTILETLKKSSDMIIIDSPPALAVTDSLVLVPFVDAVLLVIKPGFTKAKSALLVVEQFKRSNANLIGVVMNELDLGRSRYGYKYYHYKSDKSYGKYYSHEKKPG
ncbi:MAG: polysaccharide biosynthesis tyrosine autokinase [Anaerolineaceae bacterium]|nr:polysaccharide biosynthesis tyrosine autokinase [Anaerolineaceae bacterium]